MSKIKEKFPLPGDKAFAEGLYSPTQAHLKWYRTWSGTDNAIIIGFKEAADRLVDDLASERSGFQPDRFFFPVAYLYRHSLELFLKFLIKYGIYLRMLDEDEQIQDLLTRSHNLHKLWNVVRSVVEKVFPKAKVVDLKSVERIILEFHSLDKSGQRFRYLGDKEENYIDNLPQTVDLENLRAVVGRLFYFLDCFNIQLDLIKEGRDMMEEEARQNY